MAQFHGFPGKTEPAADACERALRPAVIRRKATNVNPGPVEFERKVGLEHVRGFPIRLRIHEGIAPCDSSVESAMEAEHGAGLQPGFA
jgi:hypothetical protein